MGVVKGLANIRQREEDQAARREAANAPKVTWFKIEDGQKAKVRFLQELDEDALGFNAEKGIGFVAVEHTSPIAKAAGNYSVRAVCSMDDEGKCVGCEQHQKDYKAGWKAGSKLYINVLVLEIKDATGKVVEFRAKKDGPVLEYPFVAVVSQGTSGKAITPNVMEYAFDNNTITDTVWSIKRNGALFNNTEYGALPGRPDAEPFDGSAYEVFDLDKVLRFVAYEDQAKFYQLVDDDEPSATSEDRSPVSSASTEW